MYSVPVRGVFTGFCAWVRLGDEGRTKLVKVTMVLMVAKEITVLCFFLNVIVRSFSFALIVVIIHDHITNASQNVTLKRRVW